MSSGFCTTCTAQSPEGSPPFVVVAADGGDRYWRARSNGDEPELTVVINEFLTCSSMPASGRAVGRAGGRWAVDGALLLAERHTSSLRWPRRVWRCGSRKDSRPAAFDSAQDFDVHGVLASLTALLDRCRIDCERSPCPNEDGYPFGYSSARKTRSVSITSVFGLIGMTMRFSFCL